MLIPAPSPVYTLAPGLRLDPEETASLDRALGVVTGQLGGVVVVDVRRVGETRVVEMHSTAGQLLIIEPPA